MIVPEDAEVFLRTLFRKGFGGRAFLICARPHAAEELEQLLVKFLICREKTFCRNCSGCRSSNLLDIFRYEGDALTMDQAREIQNRTTLGAFGEGKIFLLNFRFIADTSQAVLLKTLEELRANTALVIRTKTSDVFSLPFLSRLTVLRPVAREENDLLEGEPPQQVFDGGSKNMFDILKEIAKADLPQRLKRSLLWARERESCEDAFNAFELWTERKINDAKPTELARIRESLEDLMETKKRFYAKTYFNRMLLEHLIISQSYLP